MTYLDSSVILAALLSEDQRPEAAFWAGDMVSSRLTHYEVFVRLHARRENEAIFRHAEGLFRTFEWLELEPTVMARALDPFPKLAMLRTLDAMHLAAVDYLRSKGVEVEVATYDKRLADGARALGFPLARLADMGSLDETS